MDDGETLVEDPRQPSYTPLQEALKKVGIGQRGSVRLTAEELRTLSDVTLLRKCSAISKGAFLAGLLYKGLGVDEETFLKFVTRGTYAQSNKSNQSNQSAKLTESNVLTALFPSYPAKYFLEWLLVEEDAYAKLFETWVPPLAVAELSSSKPQFPSPYATPSSAQNEIDVCTAVYTTLNKVRLLITGETLSQDQADQLGQFLLLTPPRTEGGIVGTPRELFYSQGAEFIRGFCMSMLRVRYETREEWNGLYLALARTVRPVIPSPVRASSGALTTSTQEPPVASAFSKTMLIVSEPMNGFTRSAFVSPLLAWWCEKYLQMKTIHLAGSNPGPKFGFNFKTLATALVIPTLSEPTPSELPVHYVSGDYLGVMAEQKYLSPALHAWVARRREIIKRPAWATLEKFIKPIQTTDEKRRLGVERLILVTSAFHGPYFEKMCALAKFAGYAGFIIAQWGGEGGLGATLSRPLKLRAGVSLSTLATLPSASRSRTEVDALEQASTEYVERNFTGSYKDIDYPRVHERDLTMDAANNAQLISEWLHRTRDYYPERHTQKSAEGSSHEGPLSERVATQELYRRICMDDKVYASNEAGSSHFGARVRISLRVYTEALSWIKGHWTRHAASAKY